MTAYLMKDGSITDVCGVRLNTKRAREYRAAGRCGWAVWTKHALDAWKAQGGKLPEVKQEQS